MKHLITLLANLFHDIIVGVRALLLLNYKNAHEKKYEKKRDFSFGHLSFQEVDQKHIKGLHFQVICIIIQMTV